MGRVPPNNLEAEESLLGSMLLSRDAILAADLVDPEDFYKPAHGLIFQAIVAVHTAGAIADPVAVADFLERAHLLDRTGGRPALLQIQANTPASANAGHYARIVRELAIARRAIATAGELAEAGYEADLDRIADLADKAARGFAAPVGRAGAVELDDLLAREDLDESKPWVIDGILRRRERCILTGGEGWGKSTLLRQCAVTVASGLHPFTGLAAGVSGPRRALLVDLQEDELDLAEALRPMRRRAGECYEPGMLRAISRSNGMNLLTSTDRRWLEGVIADVKPELVCIGPVRKLFRPTPQFPSKVAEEAVDEVTRVLDDLRVGYNFALMMEGHAGHDRNESAYRIRGSSVWLDWPEFGLGMKPVKPNPRQVEITTWRGARHTGRPWPRQLFESKGWPWAVDEETYEAIVRGLGQDWLIDGQENLEGTF